MTSDTIDAPRPATGTTAHTTGIKTILCHVQDDGSVGDRLDTALTLARGCDAHLTCLHVTPIEAYSAFDGFGGVFVIEEALKQLDEGEARLRQSVEKRMANEDVAWDYVQVTGNVPGQILRRGAFADLIVAGRDRHVGSLPGSAVGLLGDIVVRSSTPVFVPASDGQRVDPCGTALIAWNGSYEAARAVRAAVGLLNRSSQVHVLQVQEEEKDDVFPSTELLEYLSRHGIHAELNSQSPRGAKGADVASILLAHADALGAEYLVLGGYSRSRMGEYLFGGVTRSLLKGCHRSLFILG